MHLAKINVDLYLTRKRERKAAAKRKRASIHHWSRVRAMEERRKRGGVFGDRSLIAEMLARDAEAFVIPQTSLRLQFGKTFSMFDAPEEAIGLVASFAATHRKVVFSDVFVDLSRITCQDLGAHALLDKLVDEVTHQATFQNKLLAWKGTYPKDPAQKRFIRAMGIIKQLKIAHLYLPPQAAEKIHLFERRCRHYVRTLRPVNPEEKTEQANAAERFADHINRCLSREGRRLTDASRGLLCSYVVEIIDNAENHAGMVDWTIQGYLDTAVENPVCEIVIFNFGKSIAQTLEDLDEDSYTKDQMRKYLDLHTGSGWLSRGFRREDLLTLLALQSSVSRKNTSIDNTRGQGLPDLVEFFQKMNLERQVESLKKATMYIVSGSTRILFDGRYEMVRREDSSRVIAFNDANDLAKLPDPACVMPLKGCSLPGTMIGIKFPIQAPNLENAPLEHSK